jgi:hypothetical protein
MLRQVTKRKGKSQIWDSKIWSRVPRDTDPRKTMLARASSIYKRQTRLLIREVAPEKEDRNCQRVINIWSWAPDRARHQHLLFDWPSVAMWVCLWLWLYERMERESADRQSIESCSCENLVAEAGDSSGKQTKGNVRRWKPLPSKVMKIVTDNTSLCVTVICKM